MGRAEQEIQVTKKELIGARTRCVHAQLFARGRIVDFSLLIGPPHIDSVDEEEDEEEEKVEEVVELRLGLAYDPDESLVHDDVDFIADYLGVKMPKLAIRGGEDRRAELQLLQNPVKLGWVEGGSIGSLPVEDFVIEIWDKTLSPPRYVVRMSKTEGDYDALKWRFSFLKDLTVINFLGDNPGGGKYMEANTVKFRVSVSVI
jgi:hypothetical protein